MQRDPIIRVQTERVIEEDDKPQVKAEEGIDWLVIFGVTAVLLTIRALFGG